MADDRHVQTQLLDLKKAQDAMDYAVTFAQRWPQQEFNELLLRRALRIREAARGGSAGVPAEELKAREMRGKPKGSKDKVNPPEGSRSGASRNDTAGSLCIPPDP